MRWLDDYMAIPFRDRGRDRQGCDCWGLARLILAERASIDVPPFDAIATDDTPAVAHTIAAERGKFLEVERGAELPFDIVTMRAVCEVDGMAWGGEFHMGMVTMPGHLVHTERATGVQHVPFSHPTVRDRIRRIFRHPALA